MATADWFAATAVAEPARAPRSRTHPRPEAAPTRSPRARARTSNRRITGGIVWMAALAILLAGVVALNVAVLRTNMAVDRLDRQQADLQAQNAALASQVSAASAAPRIESAAHKLGLVQAPAADTSYLDLGRP